jgi:hypothetical protein
MKTSFEILVIIIFVCLFWWVIDSQCRSRAFLVDPAWRQFRFTIGAPDAEARFKASVAEAQKTDANARKYPGLYVRFLPFVLMLVFRTFLTFPPSLV